MLSREAFFVICVHRMFQVRTWPKTSDKWKWFLLTKRLAFLIDVKSSISLLWLWQGGARWGWGCPHSLEDRALSSSPFQFQSHFPVGKTPLLRGEPPHCLPSHHTRWFPTFVILFTPFSCPSVLSQPPQLCGRYCSGCCEIYKNVFLYAPLHLSK